MRSRFCRRRRPSTWTWESPICAAGDIDRALGQFEAGLNLPSPSLPTPDWDAAIAALRQALTPTRARADAHNVLGLLLGRKGADSTEVAAEFREAIRLRPDFAEAHNNLGLVLIQAGDDQAGIAALARGSRISPDTRMPTPISAPR